MRAWKHNVHKAFYCFDMHCMSQRLSCPTPAPMQDRGPGRGSKALLQICGMCDKPALIKRLLKEVVLSLCNPSRCKRLSYRWDIRV